MTMSITAEIRAQIEKWTREWDGSDSLDGVDYQVRAGLNGTTPPLSFGENEGDSDNSVYLSIGCTGTEEDDLGPNSGLAFKSSPGGAEWSAPAVRQGEVIDFDGWAIRVTGINVESGLVHIELLAHPDPETSAIPTGSPT